MRQLKKFVAAILVMSLLLAMVAVTALAAETLKTIGQVNMRKGPGLKYATIMTIGKGKTLTYTGTSKKDSRGVTWYKAIYSGKTGWVSSKYAKKVIVTTGTVQATGTVYMRSGPGLKFKVLSGMQKGETASYLGEMKKDNRGVNWYYINYKGTKGWVSSKYTKFI